MATIIVKAQTKGVSDAIKAFDQLTKAEQKAVFQGAELGKTIGKSTKKGSDGIKNMTKNALAFATGMIGVNSASAIFSKIIATAKGDFEQLLRFQRSALSTQQSFNDAVGSLISNNPTGLTQQQLLSFQDFAKQRGAILGKGGATRVIQGLTALRSGVPGLTDEQQRGALQKGITQAEIDPSTNIGSFAVGVAKLDQSLNKGITVATSALTLFGSRAGGDIATLVKQIARVIALTATGAGTTEELLAVTAFGTAALGDPTAERTVTAVGELLGNFQNKPIKIAGKEVTFVGDTGFQKALDFIDRLKSGEFGEDRGRVLAEVATGGQSGLALLAAIFKDTATQRETLAKIQKSGEGFDFQTEQLKLKNDTLANAKTIEEQKRAQGQQTISELSDTAGASFEASSEILDSFQETLGVTRGQREGLLRQFGPTRTTLERIFGSGDDEFFQTQRKRIFLGAAAATGRELEVGERTELQRRGLRQTLGQVFEEEGENAAFIEAARGGLISATGGLNRFESETLRRIGATESDFLRLRNAESDGRLERVLSDLVDKLLEGLPNAQIEASKNSSITKQDEGVTAE